MRREWDNGIRQRLGMQILRDGSVYEDEWKGNKTWGKGRMIHANGDVYEGEWREGRKGVGIWQISV